MSSSKDFSNQLSSQAQGRELFVSGLTLWEWWKASRQEAIEIAISPIEVDWLLQEAAGLDRLSLRLESFKSQPEIPLKLPFAELQQLWQKRIQERVPVQYLTGAAPWRQFLLKVSPAVLIPRPETEELIDLAIAAVGGSGGDAETRRRGDAETELTTNNQQLTTNLTPDPQLPIPPIPTQNSKLKTQNSPLIPDSRLPTPAPPKEHWADLGTGSGAIALGLAAAFPGSIIHAVDLSEEALAIAQFNAASYHFQERICFYQGSWLHPLEHLRGKLTGIVSNPPYIPSQMVPELQPEVAQHEPFLALDGGADGLDCIRHLISTAPAYLRSGGILLFEMMVGQADVVRELLHQQGSYHSVQIHPDLAGIERFALAYRI